MLRKAVFSVVAVMLAIFGLGTTAMAIDGLAPTGQSYVNPGALGDSLIYGYYNVRGNINIFNVINTDTLNGQKVRVIFRNAKNSKECLDFSVCLSLGDVWTAFLLDDGTTARVFQFDSDTVTAPTIPAGGQAFISGTYGDGYVVTPDDCREGYFEVVGLVEIPGYDKKTCTTGPNCPRTEALCRDFNGGTTPISVPNVLAGTNAIIELSTLATYAYNATAIADTSLGVPPTPGAGSDFTVALAADNGCAEIEFILAKALVISPYDILAGIGAETEVIVTFPTRYACHKDQAAGPFEGASGNTDRTRADSYCASVTTALWNDKESRQDITAFSPSPTTCLPNEVNILRIGPSNIWNSTVALTINAGTGFDLGWVSLDLVAGLTVGANAHSFTFGGVTAFGLPAIGYTTQSMVSAEASYLTPVMFKSTQ